MTARLLFTALLGFTGSAAFAAEPADCLYEGQTELYCDGNILVAPGTVVTDHALILSTPKDIFFGDADGGVRVACSPADPSAPDFVPCPEVSINAATLHGGGLDVRGLAEGRGPAPVEVRVGSYAPDFRMNLDTLPDFLIVVRNGVAELGDQTLRWAAR